jgi:hypothetical protein
MPHSLCPACGQEFDLYVKAANRESWYAEHAADKQVGDMVNLECMNCWKAANPSTESPFNKQNP